MAKRHTHRAGDLQSLFLRLEELVLANSGQDEFEEVFKLLVAKLWDERTTGPGRFRIGNSPEGTWDHIAQLIQEANTAWPGVLDVDCQPLLTPQHLEVCVDALSTHKLSGGSLEVLDDFFEFMVSRSSKGSKGQYFTPRHVVELCVRLLRPKSGETVLDPACGSGGFLLHSLRYVQHEEGLDTGALRDYCAQFLWGFDLDERALKVAKALMLLATGGQANLWNTNSLARPNMSDLFPGGVPRLTLEDILRTQTRSHRGFDVILTNPPFAGEVREKRMLDAYQLTRGSTRAERDVMFIERCIELLKPGGRMAMVLPHNKFAAKNFNGVREWLREECHIDGVVSLGRNTFLPHTHQKASVLIVRKRTVHRKSADDARILFAISESAGKDSKGRLKIRQGAADDAPLWDRLDHDFEEIVQYFEQGEPYTQREDNVCG